MVYHSFSFSSHLYLCVRLCICMYTCTCTYMYLYIYVCIYVYISGFFIYPGNPGENGAWGGGSHARPFGLRASVILKFWLLILVHWMGGYGAEIEVWYLVDLDGLTRSVFFLCTRRVFFFFLSLIHYLHYCIVFIVAIIVCFHSSFVITLEMTPLLAGYSRFGVTPPFQFFLRFCYFVRALQSHWFLSGFSCINPTFNNIATGLEPDTYRSRSLLKKLLGGHSALRS